MGLSQNVENGPPTHTTIDAALSGHHFEEFPYEKRGCALSAIVACIFLHPTERQTQD